jgi:hypothetical protein
VRFDVFAMERYVPTFQRDLLPPLSEGVTEGVLKRRYVSTKLHGIMCQETINSKLHTDANLEVTLKFMYLHFSLSCY